LASAFNDGVKFTKLGAIFTLAHTWKEAFAPTVARIIIDVR
jgi:hypothetical protein